MFQHHQYAIRLTFFSVTACLTLSAHGQKPTILRMEQPQPAANITLKLTSFDIPPYPIKLVSFGKDPSGNLSYQTLMPIAGRMAATTDEAKLKGASAPPSGVYLYSANVDAQGQLTPGSGIVFAQPDARIKVAADTPTDWAVWNTKASDGPLRLPFGGGYDQLPPILQTSRQIKQVSFANQGSGLNYANYSLYPAYRLVTRSVDPLALQLVRRAEVVSPQQNVNLGKLPRYIPVDGEWNGQVIALSPTRYEGIATHYVDGDKTAMLRQISLLSFDEAGNLLKDQPINFTVNRKLTARLPVHDAKGQVMGTFNVFADGGGKKDARDSQENRFSVVVTDETGAIWRQFDWINGEGSARALLPTYVLRQGDQLRVYSTNQQKLFKPQEESWLIDPSGKATLIGTSPSSEVANYSREVIDTQNKVVSSSQPIGWANYSGAQYIDSFTDANGAVWLLLQRQADAPSSAPATAPSTPAPAPSGVANRLMGFANKLNQMTGQAPPTPAAAPAPVTYESGKTYSDLFVIRFDPDLKFQQQTVVRMESSPEPVRFQRSIRASGVDYVLNNAANSRLRLRGNELTVQRLAPFESSRLTLPDTDNFLINEASGQIQVLVGVPRKPGQGQLMTYALD